MSDRDSLGFGRAADRLALGVREVRADARDAGRYGVTRIPSPLLDSEAFERMRELSTVCVALMASRGALCNRCATGSANPGQASGLSRRS